MSLSSVLAIVAAAIYLWCGVSVIGSLRSRESRASSWVRGAVSAALVVHAASVCSEMFGGSEVHFGFGLALSTALLFAVAITLIESLVHRIGGLMGILLVVACAACLLQVVFPGEAIDARRWSALFRIHLLVAIGAYSFMTIAVIQAVLLMRMEKMLRGPVSAKDETGLLANLPDLMAMERILFRIVACGFVCLTLVLLLGSFATLEAHGSMWVFDHKTIFTWLSWIVFAILLVGRYSFGWRNKKALSWFWIGIGFLVVAYLLYRLVTEVLL